MGLLKQWFSKIQKQEDTVVFSAALEPEAPLYIVGDVHGRLDLLNRILNAKPQNSQLVFVGDLVDRGEESAHVLECVSELCQNGAVCLMGNHEKMMLDFLDRPTERGSRWLRHGGLQTLQNYGVRGISERASDTELLSARDQLDEKLPANIIEWLRNLPLHWSSGNIHVVHAAADPAINMHLQNPNTLMWGTSSFFKQARDDGQWVVHGHTIVDEGTVDNGRISIDTGAYATNVLTALHIDKGFGEFIST